MDKFTEEQLELIIELLPRKSREVIEVCAVIEAELNDRKVTDN